MICKPETCENITLQQWLANNPVPRGSQMLVEQWIADAIQFYLCNCGCVADEIRDVEQRVRELVQFFNGLSCPSNPLPVRDCLSQDILQQLQQINENTDELEVTAENINLNATQINLNTDEVEALLTQIRDRLLAAVCGDNPLGTTLCNPTDITTPINTSLGTLLTVLNNILTRLNTARCGQDPLGTTVCNPADITDPLVNVFQDLTVTGQDCAGNITPSGLSVVTQGVTSVRHCPSQIRWRQQALPVSASTVFNPAAASVGPVRGLDLVVITGLVDVTGPVAGDGTISYPPGTYQLNGQETTTLSGNITFNPNPGSVAFIRWAQVV